MIILVDNSLWIFVTWDCMGLKLWDNKCFSYPQQGIRIVDWKLYYRVLYRVALRRVRPTIFRQCDAYRRCRLGATYGEGNDDPPRATQSWYKLLFSVPFVWLTSPCFVLVCMSNGVQKLCALLPARELLWSLNPPPHHTQPPSFP